MHIPDNYLSPETCAVMTAAMVPVWVHAVKKVKREVPKEKMPMLGVGAAFSFTGMMFNVPLPGGTTGHAVGGTLVSGLLGPEAACISITIALLLQALLFGDGGILAFGANCFNMAFVLPFVGYAIYRLMLKLKANDYVAIAIGSYGGINAAAFAAAIEFGIQPYLFTDAAGQALYCPYGLAVSIPAMMIGHLTIFGAAEVIFTTAIYAFIRKTSPSMATLPVHADDNTDNTKAGRSWPIYALLGALILAVPAGLLATGTAWGEWELSEVGIKEGFSYSSLFPDYTMSGLPEITAYILSAIIGVALSVIIFRVISSLMKTKTEF
ncbi:MAG: cobalt transporter CbiM [Bacillota bacterium]|nr:cobalt transporter CbiM [Bacillota bacterium]